MAPWLEIDCKQSCDGPNQHSTCRAEKLERPCVSACVCVRLSKKVRNRAIATKINQKGKTLAKRKRRNQSHHVIITSRSFPSHCQTC